MRSCDWRGWTRSGRRLGGPEELAATGERRWCCLGMREHAIITATPPVSAGDVPGHRRRLLGLDLKLRDRKPMTCNSFSCYLRQFIAFFWICRREPQSMRGTDLLQVLQQIKQPNICCPDQVFQFKGLLYGIQVRYAHPQTTQTQTRNRNFGAFHLHLISFIAQYGPGQMSLDVLSKAGFPVGGLLLQFRDFVYLANAFWWTLPTPER